MLSRFAFALLALVACSCSAQAQQCFLGQGVMSGEVTSQAAAGSSNTSQL